MKQNILILFTFFLAIPAMAQKDTRARLNIHGRLNGISVSPDGRVWAGSALGRLYYADSITSYWHEHKQFYKSENDWSGSNHFDRINFFNKDTAILSGFISATNSTNKNSIFRTTDGGKTWDSVNFGGDSWIYDIHISGNGLAWMGGSSGKLFFSKDYGEHWELLTVIFKDRMATIDMLDASNGIAGELGDKLWITDDNWKTAKPLPTPLSQKLYKHNEKKYWDHRFEKVKYWGDYIIVNQESNVFYSPKNEINWQKFTVEFDLFEVVDHSKLYVFDKSGRFIVYDSPNSYKVIDNISLTIPVSDFKMVNDAIYFTGDENNFYHLKNNIFEKAELYTTDYKIKSPKKVKKATYLTWGIDGQHVYISDDFGETWHREIVTDFYIYDFYLQNDSIAILWDGNENYKYELITRNISKYFPEKPLKNFIKDSLVTITISSGTVGCFHKHEEVLIFHRNEDNPHLFSVKEYKKPDNTIAFERKFESMELEELLNDININPYKVSLYEDFNVTEEDKKAFLKSAKKNEDVEKEELAFYKEFIKHIDTISPHFRNLMSHPDYHSSTTSFWFKIELQNKGNEKITFHNRYYSSKPWQLPIVVEHRNHKFACYNIEFMRFIAALLPESFYGSQNFSNEVLLQTIAMRVYRKTVEY